MRRVDPSGRIYTVAGTGIPSPYNEDGIAATSANINWPNALAVTADGVIYIAEQTGNRIRRVDTAGTIITVAGNGQASYAGENGNPLLATLSNPSGVALGPDGSLYIADQVNYRVRRVAPSLPGLQETEVLVPNETAEEVYVFDANGRHVRTRDGLTGALRYEFTSDDGALTEIEHGDGNVTIIERNGNGELQAIVGPYGQRTEFTLDDGYIVMAKNPNDEETHFTYSDDGLMETMTDARAHAWTFTYDALGRLEHDSDPAGGSKSLVRTGAGQNYEVEVSTELGRTRSYSVETLADGTQRRIMTNPDGTITQRDKLLSRVETTTDPDGTIRSRQPAPDDRFGLQAPVLTETITTPVGNLQFSRQMTRSATLVGNDPLHLASQDEVTTINGTRIFQRNFDDGTPNDTLTEISAEGRQVVSTIDPHGRVIKMQPSGLHPIRFGYDSNGRLNSMKHGPDPDTADTRTTTLTYKGGTSTDAGYLDSMTETVSDTESRAVQYSYDGAGRTTAQTFLSPDNRTVEFEYDPTGNLNGVTPPGQPEHTFGFSPVNVLETYLPPEVAPSPTPRATTYLNNEDRQLTRITQPDGKRVDFAFSATSGNLDTVTLQPSGEVRTYSYDETSGQLEGLSAADADLAFTYDGSLLTAETWTGIGTVTHNYDNNFHQTGLQLNSTPAISFSYDQDGLMTAAGVLTLTRRADNGLLQNTTLGDTTDAWVYNQCGEPDRYTVSYNSAPLFDVQYLGRDKLGRITQKRESIEGGTAVDTYYRY